MNPRLIPLGALLLVALLDAGATLAADTPTTLPSPSSKSTHSLPTTQPSKAPVRKRPNPLAGVGAPGAGEFKIELSPMVTRLLNDPKATASEIRQLSLFHGQWDKLSDLSPTERAQLALQKFDLDNSVWKDPLVPAILRAEAALLRGQPEVVETLVSRDGSPKAILLRSRALIDLGRPADALLLLRPIRDEIHADNFLNAPDLTAATECLTLLAGLEGAPSQDYQLALSLYAMAHNQFDRFYWPSYVAESRLLSEKDNPADAADAVTEALRLNPHASVAWFQLGQESVESFNFEMTTRAINELRKINSGHPLGDQLQAMMLLAQKDAEGAKRVLLPALARIPDHRDLLALSAAADALAYDDVRLDESLKHFNRISPGNPQAYFTVGQYLSMARQYPESEAMLRKAISLSPNWPEPHVELGLLLMQAGHEDQARTELKIATTLDPFHRRAGNQLKLLDELATYERIETPHFVIKYKKGVDEVLARDMPATLEGIYRDVTSTYQHQPPHKTQIEIMPDEKAFAVRITGMPWIWTIGACTGDVIAITPPKEGPNQRGTYDWARVIRHEYTHTVTLSLTNNRIPHWFTEACAVAQEPGERDFATCSMLAEAINTNTLFALDQINWGFIRPKTPRDRPLAYGQARWMVEYITTRYGHQAVLALLGQYRDGVPDEEAIRHVTGKNGPDFMVEFKAWATGQVAAWGLGPRPADEALAKVLATKPSEIDEYELTQLLARFPNQADLLRIMAERAILRSDVEASRVAVMAYAAARPVDTWSYKTLFNLAAASDRPQEAVSSLEMLDSQEVLSGVWANQLARIYQNMGQTESAMHAAQRAVHHEPYNPTYRELLATTALQSGDADLATRQIEAMAMLEPTNAKHEVRLAALYFRQGKKAEAKEAAKRAVELDPQLAGTVRPFTGE